MATARCQQLEQHGESDNDDDQAFDMAALNQFDYIRFTLADMNGIGRCMSVPRRHVEHCLHEGLGFYAGKPASQIRCSCYSSVHCIQEAAAVAVYAWYDVGLRHLY